MAVSFGTILARLRRERRLSQATLAADANLSQRHISFLESGRARPGRTAIAKLIDALTLSRPQADALLASAGLLHSGQPISWDDPAFADARNVAIMMVDRHLPYPALICDRAGRILYANKGFQSAIMRAAAEAGGIDGVDNLYDLTLNPSGLVPFMINPEAIIPQTLHRLRIAATGHAGAAQTLERCRSYATATHSFLDAATAKSGSVLIEAYRIGGKDIRLISVTCGFGSPEDETAQDLQLELFFPVDSETEGFFAASA